VQTERIVFDKELDLFDSKGVDAELELNCLLEFQMKKSFVVEVDFGTRVSMAVAAKKMR